VAPTRISEERRNKEKKKSVLEIPSRRHDVSYILSESFLYFIESDLCEIKITALKLQATLYKKKIVNGISNVTNLTTTQKSFKSMFYIIKTKKF